jgi:hypothetical protein
MQRVMAFQAMTAVKNGILRWMYKREGASQRYNEIV